MHAIPTNLRQYFKEDSHYNQSGHIISFCRDDIPVAAYEFVQTGNPVEVSYDKPWGIITLIHVEMENPEHRVEYLADSVVFRGDVLCNNEVFWKNLNLLTVDSVLSISNSVVQHYTDKIENGDWIVNELGDPTEPGWELSVVHKDNKHGQGSWGWFKPNQKYSVCTGEDGDPAIHPALVEWARESAKNLARLLNATQTKYKED